MKVRIRKTPAEKEIDGVSLKGLLPGTVRDVPPELGLWLIAKEYADSEMRQSTSSDEQGFFNFDRPSSQPRERRAQKR